MQPPRFPVLCAACRRRISVEELATTAGTAHHTSGWRVVVCSRPCFERLRRTAPLPPYLGAATETQKSVRAAMGVVGRGLEIRPSTVPAAGMGLFATRDYPKGAPITEYIGLVRQFADAERMSREQKSHFRALFSRIYTLDGRYLPDGTLITDPAAQLQGLAAGAYANDTHGLPDAKNLLNARYDQVDSPIVNQLVTDTYPYTQDEQMAIEMAKLYGLPPPVRRFEPRMRTLLLRATSDVYAGDEVLVPYGSDYWAEDVTANMKGFSVADPKRK